MVVGHFHLYFAKHVFQHPYSRIHFAFVSTMLPEWPELIRYLAPTYRLLLTSFFSTFSETFKERIFFFTVSNSPDVLGILQSLWRQLLKAVVMPKFFNEEDAVKQLSDNLSNIELQPILVVLDDVWSESVLEKLIFRAPNLKMVITSRTKFEALDSIYSLGMLKESDAIELFYHSAFVQGNSLGDTYKELAHQVFGLACYKQNLNLLNIWSVVMNVLARIFIYFIMLPLYMHIHVPCSWLCTSAKVFFLFPFAFLEG